MTRSSRLYNALAVSATLLLTACGGGGSGGGPVILPTFAPTTPTPPPGSTAFTCPSSIASFAVASSAGSNAEARHVYPPRSRGAEMNNALTVTYASARASEVETALDQHAIPYGARKLGGLVFNRLGTSARVISVDASHRDALRAVLASTPGVLSVTPSQRLFTKRVTTPFITNDPYFRGATGQSAPLYQSASTAGQWDMHVLGMEYAFGYSQSGNGSGIVNASALGSTAVKLAVIDTGMDVTHPDLSGNSIVRTRCFITDTNNIQSTGTFVTDPQGHGTDVTGIAADGVNNGYGFVGTGGNISLMLYRVFPTPDDNCLSNTTTDPQCGAADIDIASAMNDAVANGANVISLSLGGGSCTSGQDPSSVEGAAVANAIASNVIVVAASGNESASTPDAPGCDPGVISVGASAYNDGQPNGTGFTGTRTEYVASYSNSNATLVAPGGDPTANTATTSDNDDLHWIENIWTSTPFDSNFAGSCATDVFGESSDCRVLIAGTSMATPHVGGAAALILSVNSTYQSPTAMKTLLCSTADNINDPNQGCGRINVYRAMATALHDASLP